MSPSTEQHKTRLLAFRMSLLSVIFFASCTGIKTDLPGTADFYLNGNVTRTFQYAKIFPDGDRENGHITYKVTGTFGKPNEQASYSLTGHVDMDVTYDYSYPLNIVDLPLEVLQSFYRKSEIESVIMVRDLTGEESKQMSVTGDCKIVERNISRAPSVFTKPVKATYKKCDNSPVNSQLFGEAYLHVDEAGMVWLKDVLMRCDLFFYGNYETTAIKPIGQDEIEVEMNYPDGHLCYRLKKAHGLISLECHEKNGVHTKMEELPSKEISVLK